jgi:endonuclease YncB( thermonuclease family)
MKKIVLLPLITLLLASAAITNSYAETKSKKVQIVVTRVHDGDTINAVMNNKKVTICLADIECPENRINDTSLRQSNTMQITQEEVKVLGQEAQKTLKKLLEFKEGKIYFEETPEKVCKTGNGNSLVGILYADKTNVNEYMLRNSKCMPVTCADK